MKAKCVVTTLIIMFGIASIAIADSSLIQNTENGHWYQRIDTTMTWHSAKTYSESLGGYLASVTSQQENDFIYSNIGIDGLDIWLGATDEVQEGNWQWVTGESWSFTNWGATVSTTNPDNYNNEQHYLTFWSATPSKWDDYYYEPRHSNEISMIIEWNTQPPVVPEPISSILFVAGGATLFGRRYLTRRHNKSVQ